MSTFPNTLVHHLPKIQSDHRPILIKTHGAKHSTNRQRPFKYIASLATHPDFSRLVRESWAFNRSVSEKILNLITEAQIWNQSVFGHIINRKKRLKARINGIQKSLESYPSSRLEDLDAQLRREYEEACLQEGILWMQKSRSEWINLGDRKTAYYHAKATKRRRRNLILSLKDDDGGWCDDEERLREMAVSFFRNLDYCDNSACLANAPRGLFPKLDHAQMEELRKDISNDEIRKALFDMKPLKAPGADGLHAAFFQTQWHIVVESLCSMIKGVFNGNPLEPSLNKTLIALVPKTQRPGRPLNNLGQLACVQCYIRSSRRS